jgi:DNA helicase-2/ATP-dependent DNA helicase PcrA
VTPVKELLAMDYPQYLEIEADISTLHDAYVKYKREHNLMDYDDLLLNLAMLLRKNEAVRATLSDRYKYIMVDEYQDTNKLQAEIVKLLAFKHRNLMVVGDDAQCIYSFRGSTIQNILTFGEDFKDYKIIKLEENYRSTQPILNLANEILLRGGGRLG